MPLSGHRILVVEDEFPTAFDVKSIIREAHGEVVAHAASLAKAMKFADIPSLSLAVLDVQLGFDTSFPVAAKLQAAGVPFIFHTGYSVSLLSEAWPSVPIVSKPAAPGRLVNALRLAAKRAIVFGRSKAA